MTQLIFLISTAVNILIGLYYLRQARRMDKAISALEDAALACLGISKLKGE